jgi:hypothetical protein
MVYLWSFVYPQNFCSNDVAMTKRNNKSKMIIKKFTRKVKV